ncbi:MAG: hypothetical protein JST51_20360 [Armatimonadetes bacterium]|nr:hypothetical protein [Armatimonadota bacterium]
MHLGKLSLSEERQATASHQDAGQPVLIGVTKVTKSPFRRVAHQNRASPNGSPVIYSDAIAQIVWLVHPIEQTGKSLATLQFVSVGWDQVSKRSLD